ncbi:glycosyl hydrolase, partial [Myxococcota bacterium]|nr:glycosyl hydrolase [Myxococcota bacterium]
MDDGEPSAGPVCILLCPTTFVYTKAETISNVRIAGEWQGFDLLTATTMTGPDTEGRFTATVDLPPGLNAYKIVHQGGSTSELCSSDGSGNIWCMDHTQTRRKYVGGTENSAVLVPDCSLPSFEVVQSQATYGGGTGTYDAQLSFLDGIEGSGPDLTGYEATLTKDFTSRALTGSELVVAVDGSVTVALSGLNTGKYKITLSPRTLSGKAGEPTRLIFWVEEEEFSWDGALVYMVMTDRFIDGDSSNNPGPTPGAEATGDFYGGDLAGLAAAISDGTLDALGVRAIWLSPFQTNPNGAYLAADGVHQVTGYHGYWPIKAREVDPRLGGEQALRQVVIAAHAHGIRILQDYVLNHVHEDHEYNLSHPEWFRTGCVCGTQNCDWTEHALDCMFQSYLPDINHTVMAANNQFVADAIWWLDDFDLDGLRVDAVKHVEEIATRNLSAAVRETFEAAGTRYFLMGETAMGWSDCADPCNDENYNTISKYIGPQGLDGQFDFVLYHGVSYRTFAYGDQGMLHADYWLQHGLSKWPEGAVMTPYIGSHDTARFASMADYRGQDSAHDRGIVNNQWSNIAAAPTDAEPYRRLRVGMTWLMGLPGAPLLYYGDEYGQWGGVDPNNRMMWRSSGALSADEQETLTYLQKLGTARRNLRAFHHGDYVSLGAT